MSVSVVNAVRNILSDSFWGFKLLCLTLPVFSIFHFDLLEKYKLNDFILIAIIFSTFYFGSAAFLMNKNINNKTPILPSFFTIPSFVKSFVFGSLLSIPMLTAYIYIIRFIAQNFNAEPIVMNIIYACVTIFLAPFMFIPMTLYSVRENFADAFNLKIFYNAAGNFTVSFLAFIIQYFFIIGIPWYIAYRIFYDMVTIDTCVHAVHSFFLVLSFFTFYSYCSDMYGEVIPRIKIKKNFGKNKLARGTDILDD